MRSRESLRWAKVLDWRGDDPDKFGVSSPSINNSPLLHGICDDEPLADGLYPSANILSLSESASVEPQLYRYRDDDGYIGITKLKID